LNLFVVGWGLSEERGRRLIEELGRTSRLYPQLDHASLWHRSLPGGVVLGSVQTAAAVAEPRLYRHTDGGATVVYDGLPIDPTGAFAAHRADQLLAHWPDLIETIEGRFCIVRLTDDPPALELITDPLGNEQLYFAEDPASGIASNSAGLVQRAIGATEPDPLGVSMFLAVDWVGGDRTLRRGVHAADGAQHWRWQAGESAWTKRQFWNIGRNTGPPDRRVDEDLVRTVVADITRFCAAAADITGTLNAPITGGKDSRMLAAILMTAGLPARYWTKGDAGSLDLKIGLEIAARHHLPHRVSNRPTQAEDGRDPTLDIATEWESLARDFVGQNDGLASLFLVGNIQGQPKKVAHLAVTLTAMCAESSRDAYGQSWILDAGGSLERAQRFLPFTMFGPASGLVSGEAFALTARHIRELLARWSDEGVPLENLPAAFYIDERCRRWGMNNPRELAQTEDKVLPFLTRPYVQAALSMQPDQRTLQRLHREIIRTLIPGFDVHPPVDIPWRESVLRPNRRRRLMNEVLPRVPYIARRSLLAARERVRPRPVGRVLWSPYDEESWLEANLTWARDIAFASEQSPVWDYVSRRKLEKLLEPGTAPAARRRLQLPIFAALTMFQFEQIERTLLAAGR